MIYQVQITRWTQFGQGHCETFMATANALAYYTVPAVAEQARAAGYVRVTIDINALAITEHDMRRMSQSEYDAIRRG